MLAEQYLAFEPCLQRGITVSLSGKIYRDTWDQALPPDAKSIS